MIADRMKPLMENNSLLRAMFEEGNQRKAKYGEENVFDFSLGNPDAPPPQAIKKALLEILEEEPEKELHGYMNNAGFPDVRKTIADHINQTHIAPAQGDPLTENNILMATGAAGGLNIALKTILNPGEEVIVFPPYFMEYNWYVSNFGGKIVQSPTTRPDFQPDLQALEQNITPKTRAVLINSPNNPTGAIYSRETICAMAQILSQKQKQYGTTIFLLSDEPYREIAYDGISVPYVTNYYPNTIVAYSYSKSLSLPGERIGYLVIPPGLSDSDQVFQAAAAANRTTGFVNAPSLQQKLIKKCVRAKVDLSYYENNRKILTTALADMGFSFAPPQGTFYLFIKSPIDDDKAFCQAAKKYNILLVPGTSFAAPGYLRLAYCVSPKTIQNAIPAFRKLAADAANQRVQGF